MNVYKKWLMLIVFLLSLLLMIASILNYFFVIKPVYKFSNFELPNTRTLVVGASHSATSLDTREIDGVTNVAQSGEPLFYTYYKSRVLVTNNNIKHLIVAISPIHLAKYSDEHIFNNTSGSRKFSMDYFFLIDNLSDPLINRISSDYIIAFSKFNLGVPFSYMGDMRLLFNYYLKSPILNDYAFIGGVESYEGNNIAQSLQIAKAKFYFFDKLNNVEVSELGKESIKRLFRLSEELNIKVSVITTPMHPYFNSLIPNMIQEEFDQLITDLLITFPDVDYFDLSSFQLQNNDFLDGDHLNSNGASKFTEKITSLGLFDAP